VFFRTAPQNYPPHQSSPPSISSTKGSNFLQPKEPVNSDLSITFTIHGHCLPKGDDLLVQQFDALMGADTRDEKMANSNLEFATSEHVSS
jgi:hypothetical protein